MQQCSAGKVWQRRQPEATTLNQVVRSEWATFVAGVEAGERSVPRFCLREAEGYLRCGMLQHGFARVRCVDCCKDDVVAFSWKLCRYAARPSVAESRLSLLPDRRVCYELKRRWRCGTTHVVMKPEVLMQRLVALVPRPRRHLMK
ncbi:MAG: transposase [Planctomycetota bacterium]